MVFSDFNVMDALESVEQVPDIVNLSLGGVGCSAQGIGERLALARVMNNMRVQNPEIWFVAAAGNNSADVLHFPAAWRNDDVTTVLTAALMSSVDETDQTAVDNANLVVNDVAEMHELLASVIFAVGSVEEDGTTTSWFSNCGDWVNAVAFGSLQIGEYPSSVPPSSEVPNSGYPDSGPGAATWSGTSFATANFTGALSTGFFDNNPAGTHTPTGARMTNGLSCP
jgi:hypothetical protein